MEAFPDEGDMDIPGALAAYRDVHYPYMLMPAAERRPRPLRRRLRLLLRPHPGAPRRAGKGRPACRPRRLPRQRINLHRNAAISPTSRFLPGGVETEMREHFMSKLGQVRVAAVAGIWLGVYDLGPDARRALAQHDDPSGEE